MLKLRIRGRVLCSTIFPTIMEVDRGDTQKMKMKIVCQNRPLSFHDCWRVGINISTLKAILVNVIFGF